MKLNMILALPILFALVPLSIFAQQDVLIEEYLDRLENLKKVFSSGGRIDTRGQLRI
ncbi:hypothetical protein [Maribacter sp. TH_r10]|uniref:hypothetical protein n=1 Tax=Maribacter sp. TH_r10 TaxID=3082086 RepID=UPI003986314A